MEYIIEVVDSSGYLHVLKDVSEIDYPNYDSGWVFFLDNDKKAVGGFLNPRCFKSIEIKENTNV